MESSPQPERLAGQCTTRNVVQKSFSFLNRRQSVIQLLAASKHGPQSLTMMIPLLF